LTNPKRHRASFEALSSLEDRINKVDTPSSCRVEDLSRIGFRDARMILRCSFERVLLGSTFKRQSILFEDESELSFGNRKILIRTPSSTRTTIENNFCVDEVFDEEGSRVSFGLDLFSYEK
jgi:hypothetical protein